MRRTAGSAALLLLLAQGLVAQDQPATPPPRSWSEGVVHYGKWTAAAAALGLTILAAHEHDRANSRWQHLLALCDQDNTACEVGADGRYLNAQAELDYQQTLHLDHRARSRLLGAQVSLLASATLFILDLRHREGSPPNIPFGGSHLEVTAEPRGDGARVGIRFDF